MEWKDAFPSDRQPSMGEIADYIGGDAKGLWLSLIEYLDTTYKAKPKLFYSVCSGKPGWNVKFQKSGQALGTLYPEENSFSVLLVISYKLDSLMDAILGNLSPYIAELYKQAGDYMKLGKWIMFRVTDEAGVEDYKKIISVKMGAK
jgi:hypothetical protein